MAQEKYKAVTSLNESPAVKSITESLAGIANELMQTNENLNKLNDALQELKRTIDRTY